MLLNTKSYEYRAFHFSNTTTRQLIRAQNIRFSPNDTLQSTIYPTTSTHWMGIDYEWLKSKLNTYVIINSTSRAQEQGIASQGIDEWVTPRSYTNSVIHWG